QWDQGLADLDAAYDHLASMPAVTGSVGLMGFCLGGRLAWHLAARHPCDAAVAYYPSGVSDALGEATRISCPLLIHVGSEDPYLPAEAVDALRGAVADQANVELQVHTGAGHAFDNHEAAMFHHRDAAAAAWEQTVAFLRLHLPT
ncbi:MAG: dienelactone hydrolase family protein, partial [Acidimicrobiales bacterium]